MNYNSEESEQNPNFIASIIEELNENLVLTISKVIIFIMFSIIVAAYLSIRYGKITRKNVMNEPITITRYIVNGNIVEVDGNVVANNRGILLISKRAFESRDKCESFQQLLKQKTRIYNV